MCHHSYQIRLITVKTLSLWTFFIWIFQLSLLAFVSTFYLALLEVSETNGGLNLTHILAIFFL